MANKKIVRFTCLLIISGATLLKAQNEPIIPAQIIKQPTMANDEITQKAPTIKQKKVIEQPPGAANLEAPAKPSQEKSEPALTPKEVAQLQRELEPDFEFNFNNTSLQNIVSEISRIYKITFLTDDAVKVPDSKVPPLSDSKISFKTNKALPKKQAFDLFTKLLELAGWSITPTNDPKLYRITVTDTANKSPLPTFINTPVDTLPQNEQRIRYICLLENSSTDQMVDLLNKLKSQKAVISTFPLLQALIITDTAYNVHNLISIIKALDKTTEPQTLSILNLKEADANETAALIKDLQSKDDPSTYTPWAPKKETSLYYFSKTVTIAASPRTNSLILVGAREEVERIKQFITKYIDPELKMVSHPLHAYQLDYAPAEQVAEILNKVVQFGKRGSSAKDVGIGELGGVRGGLRYFGDVFIQPEKQSNRLLVRASAEDYAHLTTIIDELDSKQPQVAVEVMVVSIAANKKRQWGIQWNTKKKRTVNAQLSGFFDSPPLVEKTGTPNVNSNSLISNLIQLATIPGSGTTLLTLGKQSVYAILGLLNTNGQTRLIASPFIVTTNKYHATVGISEVRRAQLQQIVNAAGTDSSVKGFEDATATVSVNIVPQINDHGVVNLDITVLLEEFSLPANTITNGPENANKLTQKIHTNANVADHEVIALGGLIKKKNTTANTRFPILSKIPIIGYLFKNESHENDDSYLVVFMSPTIIQPSDKRFDRYTENKTKFTKGLLTELSDKYETDKRDPVFRWFFGPTADDFIEDVDSLSHKGEKPRKKIKKTTPHPDKTPAESTPAQPEQNVILNSVMQPTPTAQKDKDAA